MNLSDAVSVNGNILPSQIVKRIYEDTWIEPTNKSNLLQLILNKSPLKNDRQALERMMKDFCLYDLDCMSRESKAYKNWRDLEKKSCFMESMILILIQERLFLKN